MPDYLNAQIYKLWSPQGEEDEIYYGSSCDELHKRKSSHKLKHNKCSSKTLFEKYDDVRIELVEKYPCNNKQELLKKEGEYIRNNNCLNKAIPDRTNKEWRDDNIKKVLEKQKIYRENHKEKIKEYYENNKDEQIKKQQVYYENNKEKILEKWKTKITCDCGCIITKVYLKKHLLSNKHLELININI